MDIKTKFGTVHIHANSKNKVYMSCNSHDETPIVVRGVNYRVTFHLTLNDNGELTVEYAYIHRVWPDKKDVSHSAREAITEEFLSVAKKWMSENNIELLKAETERNASDIERIDGEIEELQEKICNLQKSRKEITDNLKNSTAELSRLMNLNKDATTELVSS